ncbi:MAG: alpha/beta hydrolase [Bacteroidota bacterium]
MEKVSTKLKKERFTAVCEDGVELKGLLLIPDRPKAVVQFNGGTAAKKEFYLPFLEYLAEHGFICCLWDYRDSGESAPEDLGKCDYQFSDYGIKDMPAIKDFLAQKFPEYPFLFFGHSAGGQQIGFMNNLDDVKGMVAFAVSTGYMPNMPFSYRLLSYFFFYIFSPISIALTGYVNAKRFGIMEDLAKNVVRQWRDWCIKKDYFFDNKFYCKSVPEGHFKNYQFPIHTFWTVDDTISNERNTHNYWKNVQGEKPITFTKIVPSEYGLKSIGHFGFFKKRMKDIFWPMAVEKLDSFID